MSPKRTKRSYRSPIRGEHARQTRARIVDAVFEEFRQVRPLSLARVAGRAGVAVPTVYRHFPTSGALMAAAVARIEAILDYRKPTTDIEHFIRMIPNWFEHFDRNEPLIHARFHMAALKDFREVMLKRRGQEIAHAMRKVTAPMSKADAARAVGLIRVLQSAHAWELLRVGGLSGREAGEVAAWAVSTLVKAMRQGAPRWS